jgi:hypothetical protein
MAWYSAFTDAELLRDNCRPYTEMRFLLSFPFRQLISESILCSVSDFIQLTKVITMRLQRTGADDTASSTEDNKLSYSASMKALYNAM